MRKAIIMVLVGLLVIVVGLLLGGCKKPAVGSVDKSGHNPADQAGPDRGLTMNTVRIRAYARTAPYEVIVEATDEVGGHEGSHYIVTDTTRAYTQTLTYGTGRKIEIRVEVKPPTVNAHPMCEIWDGTAHKVSEPQSEPGAAANGVWRAVCYLTTSR